MRATKICFCCNVEHLLSDYHKHAKMKDGRLNKCKHCVLKSVALWRTKNPGCRIKENRRKQNKAGKDDRATFNAKREKNAIGKKVTKSKYSHKRRLQLIDRTVNQTELDVFVIEEALALAVERTNVMGIPWSMDHIVPLNHKKASGLHNAYNIQVVPAVWNSIKGNRNMNLYVSGY